MYTAIAFIAIAFTAIVFAAIAFKAIAFIIIVFIIVLMEGIRIMKKTALKLMAAAILLAAPVAQFSAAGEPVIIAAASGRTTRHAAKKYYVTSDVLQVRSGPGTQYSSIGSLTRGMQVKVFSMEGEKENRWAKIRFVGVTAYVSAKHLTKK